MFFLCIYITLNVNMFANCWSKCFVCNIQGEVGMAMAGVDEWFLTIELLILWCWTITLSGHEKYWLCNLQALASNWATKWFRFSTFLVFKDISVICSSNVAEKYWSLYDFCWTWSFRFSVSCRSSVSWTMLTECSLSLWAVSLMMVECTDWSSTNSLTSPHLLCVDTL